MTDGAARAYDFRMIPIASIDPPDVSMRETMDDDKLAELATDIKENGLRQPLGVRAVGDRFRISYGHRRRIACEMVGELVVPCFVIADDDDEEQNAKLSENWFREDTNAAEEATYFAHQLEHRFGGDIEFLCRRLRVSESRVNGRLDLLRGDLAVYEALKRRDISLAVAREVNRMKDPAYRALRLDDAVKQGATAAVVRQWRTADEKTLEIQRALAEGRVLQIEPSTEASVQSDETCILCVIPGDTHDMNYVRVHRSCLLVHQRQQRAAIGSQG